VPCQGDGATVFVFGDDSKRIVGDDGGDQTGVGRGKKGRT